MEYYLSEYTTDATGRRFPIAACGGWTGVDLGPCIVVALPDRNDGPGRVHLCSDPKAKTAVPAKVLGARMGCALTGDTLGVTLAELLLKHVEHRLHPSEPHFEYFAVPLPGGGTKWESRATEHHATRYEIWLGNELIWWMPCVRGGISRSDNFNRADETPLTTGGKWLSCTGRDLPDLVDLTPLDPSTGAIKATKDVGTRHRAARWNPADTPFTGNHAAQLDNVSLYSTVEATARNQPAANTFYSAQFFTFDPAIATQEFFLYKMIAGVDTTLASGTQINQVFPANGGTIRIEINGSTLKLKFKGFNFTTMTLIYSITDSAISGGMPGFDISSRPTGSPGGGQDQFADNFFVDGDIDGAQFGQPINC